jgi:hypothetical protein
MYLAWGQIVIFVTMMPVSLMLMLIAWRIALITAHQIPTQARKTTFHQVVTVSVMPANVRQILTVMAV